MDMKIKVDDRLLKAKMRRFPAKAKAALQKGVNASAIFIENEMQKNTPVDTSNLLSSIGIRTGNLKATVAPETKYKVPYAIFVEKGTSRMEGRFYVRNTLKENKGKAGAIGAKIVSRELKRI